MLAKVRHLAAPPQLADALQYQTARLLHLVLFILIVGDVAIAINYLIIGDYAVVTIMMIALLIFLLAYYLLRRERLNLASNLVVFTLLIMTTYLALTGAGIYDESVIVFPVLLIVASVLLKRRAFIILAFLVIFSTGLIIYGEMMGVVAVNDPEPVSATVFRTLALVLAIIAALARLLTETLFQYLTEAQVNEKALLQSNSQLQDEINERRKIEQRLQQAHDSLEIRVAERTEAMSAANSRLQAEISDRSQLDLELRHSQERVFLALNAIGGGLWDEELVPGLPLSEQSGNAFFAAWGKKLLGYDPDVQLDNISVWDDHVLPEDRPAREQNQNDHFDGLTAVLDHQYRIRRVDGEIRWIRGVSRIIRNDAGQPVRWSGIDWDVTEQRQEAEELRQHRQHLQALVAARTEELTQINAQLQQEIGEPKQAEAERQQLITDLQQKNAELERFTYTVSHDLKSPLVTVRGFLGYLEQDAAAGDMERFQADLHHIRQAADKMSELLDDLLHLSRIGRVVNTPQTVPFAELVDEALTRVTEQLAARKVQVNVAPDLPSVFVDRPRLVEVLQNLLENGVKFMGEQPTPAIAVGMTNIEDEAAFFVQDNGIGIASSYQERIFELFHRLDPTITGTGVGLALVKRIIEVHDGRIWVESAGPGQGSIFYFTLSAPVAHDQEITLITVSEL